MYTQFFGLRDKPFSLSPDPRFLYLSDSHREALAHLLYGIEQGEGFIAITGEVGTGKTTLCRTLLERIEPGTEVAFIFNPQLSGEELLQSIAAELGLETEDRTRRELTEQLNRFLLAKKREGRRVLLIIDEAQVLEREALEQVRLLSNLETSTAKLIQIVLIGQPELDTLLEAPDLRQLRQRITVRWRLGPLSANETREYVRHRLRIAAGQTKNLFTDGALREIHRHSRGVPRLINLLCDRSLLAGFAAGVEQVGLGLVTQVESELQVGGHHEPALPDSPHRRRTFQLPHLRSWLPVAATLAAAAIATLLVLASVAPTWLGLDAPEVDPAALPPLEGEATELVAAPPPVDAAPPGLVVLEPASDLAFDLDRALRELTPATWTAASVDAVLEAWGGESLGVQRLSARQGRAMLQADGFSLFAVDDATLDELLAIDRPAILLLSNPPEEPREVLLRSVSGDRATVSNGSGGLDKVALSDVTFYWTGTAIVPWRDSAELPDLLLPGAQGVHVLWLQDALQGLGFESGAVRGTYGAGTAAGVRAFQESVGLAADGRVGPMTQLRLSERLGTEGPPPRLRSRQ